VGNKREGLTDKQERFCLNLFQGMSQRVAYIDAGYSSKRPLAQIDVDACRLAVKPKIILRLTELREAAEKDSVASRIEVEQMLTEIIRGRVTNYLDGNKINASLNNLNTAAIQEVNTAMVIVGKGDDALEVEVTKLKLHDPVKAASELAKLKQWYPTQSNDNYLIIQKIINNLQVNNISIESLPDEELKLLAFGGENEK